MLDKRIGPLDQKWKGRTVSSDSIEYLSILNERVCNSLEMSKIIQGYFISVDVEGYSHVRKQFIKAASVSLNEELGQVNFIFSDKTGTLTCNKMEFKMCVIGNKLYGRDSQLKHLKSMIED